MPSSDAILKKIYSPPFPAVCCLAKMAVFDVHSDSTNQVLAVIGSAKLQNVCALHRHDTAPFECSCFSETLTRTPLGTGQNEGGD